MKSRKFSVAIVAGMLFSLVGPEAFASDKWLGERGDNWLDHIASTKSRAEVMAELKQAREQGLVRQGEDPKYPVNTTFKSTRSREEVRAEAIAASKGKMRNSDYAGGR